MQRKAWFFYMGKDAANRRAWVKNVAIIFLVVLLLLTFFSNTILNYSLPEVSAQYAKYGSISNAIKLTGTVKANENYSVIYEEKAAEDGGVSQTRKVVSVYVKTGDMVELGQPILALKGGASDELKKAEEDLAAKQQAYDLALLQDTVDNLNGGDTLAKAEQAIVDLKDDLAKLNELYSRLLSGTDTTDVIEAQIKALNKSIKTMTKEKSEAELKISELEGKIRGEEGKIEDDFSGVSLSDRLTLAKKDFDELELQYYALTDALEAAQAALELLTESSDGLSDASQITTTIKSLEDQISSLDKTILRAREDFADTLKDMSRASEVTETPAKPASTQGNTEDGLLVQAGETTESTETTEETAAGTVLVTAHIKSLPLEIWKDLEDAVIRSYDWESIMKRFENIFKKYLKANGINTSDEAVLAEIEEFINASETSVKAHKRSIEDYDEQLIDLGNKLDDERQKLLLLGFNEVDDMLNYAVTQQIADAQKEVDKTKKELDEVTADYNEAKAKVDSLTTQSQSEGKIGEYQTQLDTWQAAFDDLESKLEKANEELEELNDQLTDASEGMSQKPEDVADQIAEKKKAIESAETALAITKATGAVSDATKKNERAAQLKEIEALKAKIETYKNAPETTDVTAPIAGRIVSIDYVPGNSITSGATVAQIEISEKGYLCEISVASEEARKIQVGAECTISNSWWYSEINAKVTQIRSDPQSQGKNRIIVIEVKGDVYDGQSLTFSIGDKSQSYDSVLPNSAIREDSDGKFVLTVQSKKTPLGVRYTAVRYDVEIIASDDTQSAVSGLYGNEFIIINATSPVSDGQQVRLAEN